MLKKLRKSNEGFTIIEVLIVLAIAALILLIVFLAVPALQRNQRNTSRKQDVARVGGAATEFVSNNNGTVPANSNGNNATTDAGKIAVASGKLSQYDITGAVAFLPVFSVSDQATVGTGTITDVRFVRLVTGARCDTTNIGQVAAGTSRQMAIQYATEVAGGGNTGTALCVDI